MILKLYKSIEFDDIHQPVSLIDDSAQFAGKFGSLIAWGYKKNNNLNNNLPLNDSTQLYARHSVFIGDNLCLNDYGSSLIINGKLARVSWNCIIYFQNPCC